MDWQAASLWQPYWIKCKHQVLALVYSQPDLGTIYTNFWHTVAMYVNPIFWALLDNKQLLFKFGSGYASHYSSHISVDALNKL